MGQCMNEDLNTCGSKGDDDRELNLLPEIIQHGIVPISTVRPSRNSLRSGTIAWAKCCSPYCYVPSDKDSVITF